MVGGRDRTAHHGVNASAHMALDSQAGDENQDDEDLRGRHSKKTGEGGNQVSYCPLPPQTSQRFHSIEKRVETLVAHPLPMTFPLTSRTSFVAVAV